MNPLFTPFRVRNITLPNRIVMAPMTRGQSPAGIPGPEVAAYYRRRAQQGVGLIITEGTGIDHPAALGMPNVPFFTALKRWRDGPRWLLRSTVRAGASCRSCGMSEWLDSLAPSRIRRRRQSARPA
jgi:hypothetical protein